MTRFKLPIFALVLLSFVLAGSLHSSIANALMAYDAYSGLTFRYYTQEDRLQTANELIDMIEKSYSLLEIKRVKQGISLKAEADKYRGKIKSIPDTDDPYLQAKSNLEFFDQTKEFVARFKDSHFNIRASRRPSEIYLGFSIEKIKVVLPQSETKTSDPKKAASSPQYKYVLGKIAPKVLDHLSNLSVNTDWFLPNSDYKSLQPGDEVLKYNNKSVEEAISEVEPYTSASSNAVLKTDTLSYLTSRAWKYPTSNTVTLKIKKKADGSIVDLRFPWFTSEILRGDESLFFSTHHYLSGEVLKYTWNPEKSVWQKPNLEFTGYKQNDALKTHLKEVREFVDTASDSLVLRSGYFWKDGKVYGVLQYFNFYSKDLAENQKPITLIEAFRSIVSEFKTRKVPMILDLRNNLGGWLSNVGLLTSILMEPDKVYRDVHRAYRLTGFLRELWDAELLRPSATEPVFGFTRDHLRHIMNLTLRSKSFYTPAIAVQDRIPDPVIKGYPEKIVVLTGPSCMSACDLISMSLKENQRAVLLGTPTNGTGAGTWDKVEGTVNLPGHWNDSGRVLYAAQIPNTLFGKPGTKSGEYILKEKVEDLNSENIPVDPHQTYETTQYDFDNSDLGWLEAASAILEKK